MSVSSVDVFHDSPPPPLYNPYCTLPRNNPKRNTWHGVITNSADIYTDAFPCKDETSKIRNRRKVKPKVPTTPKSLENEVTSIATGWIPMTTQQQQPRSYRKTKTSRSSRCSKGREKLSSLHQECSSPNYYYFIKQFSPS